MQDLIHRKNQTAHISLQILAISKSVETKSTRSASFPLAHPASSTSELSPPRFPQEHRSVRPSGVPLYASAPPVRGYLRITPKPRNPFLQTKSHFFRKPLINFAPSHKKQGFSNTQFLHRPRFTPTDSKIRRLLPTRQTSKDRVTPESRRSKTPIIHRGAMLGTAA